MTLAIFDLDHTLIIGDSDYLWGEYMVANELVNEREYRAENQRFYQNYKCGTLDNDSYLAFSLAPLTHHSIEKLQYWRKEFVETCIKPIVAPGTASLLQQHREQGHELMIISATNLFISAPIAELLGVPTILATRPEIINNQYTGRYLGTPTYQAGKVVVLQQWLSLHQQDLGGSYFYSDSINDLALLETVETPIAVHPDAELQTIAQTRGWPIIDLR